MMEWRICKEAPAYEVSSEGDVRRADTRHILRPSESHGYWHVILMVRGKRRCRSVHRLVAIAFHGDPPSVCHHAAHGDGNRKNNAASNLRWATPTENTADRIKHGTLHVRPWNAKLNDTDIERVLDQAKSGCSLRSIAARFGVRDAYIGKVVRGLKRRQYWYARHLVQVNHHETYDRLTE